jgi:hypothetical protein
MRTEVQNCLANSSHGEAIINPIENKPPLSGFVGDSIVVDDRVVEAWETN